MPAAVRLGDEWRIAMVELLRYGSARFATTSQASPPLCVSSRQAKRRVRLAGGLWDPILCYCLIFIDHFLAYMNIRRGYGIYTRVGDFDPPTHQPTNIYIIGAAVIVQVKIVQKTTGSVYTNIQWSYTLLQSVVQFACYYSQRNEK